MKIVIAGGRYFTDYKILCQFCDEILQNQNMIKILSGGARGADLLGENYAKERNYKLVRFPAAWNKYGKRAGVLRNAEMAKYADFLIAFWDGKSKGTLSMINLAEKQGLKVYVYYY
jgi:hypothetical protein